MREEIDFRHTSEPAMILKHTPRAYGIAVLSHVTGTQVANALTTVANGIRVKATGPKEAEHPTQIVLTAMDYTTGKIHTILRLTPSSTNTLHTPPQEVTVWSSKVVDTTPLTPYSPKRPHRPNQAIVDLLSNAAMAVMLHTTTPAVPSPAVVVLPPWVDPSPLTPTP